MSCDLFFLPPPDNVQPPPLQTTDSSTHSPMENNNDLSSYPNHDNIHRLRASRLGEDDNDSNKRDDTNDSIARKARRAVVEHDVKNMKKMSIAGMTQYSRNNNSSSSSGTYGADKNQTSRLDRDTTIRSSSSRINTDRDTIGNDNRFESAARKSSATADSSRKLSSAAATVEVYKDIDIPPMTYRRISAWDNKYERKYSAADSYKPAREHKIKGMAKTMNIPR